MVSVNRPTAWYWEMHGWIITAHGKHRGIKRYVDLCQPPLCVQESDDFIRLVPLYEKEDFINLVPTQLPTD